ncbi:MAG: metal-dependent transcriptional regulator [Saprospiraceae bacterium]
MPTSVKEDYLKALYYLDSQDGQISVTELSRKLGVSKPTVTNMVKSLEEQGWVKTQKYKPVRLTAKGKKAAALVIRKHRLTEMFLYKIMGLGWEEVHEIAEQIEHIDSEKFFARMDDMLNHPTIDPHGSPIPDKNGKVVQLKLKALVELSPGQKGRLSALLKDDVELVSYLNELGIELGTVIELVKVESFDGSCRISCDGKMAIVVSERVGACLLVEVVG